MLTFKDSKTRPQLPLKELLPYTLKLAPAVIGVDQHASAKKLTKQGNLEIVKVISHLNGCPKIKPFFDGPNGERFPHSPKIALTDTGMGVATRMAAL